MYLHIVLLLPRFIIIIFYTVLELYLVYCTELINCIHYFSVVTYMKLNKLINIFFFIFTTLLRIFYLYMIYCLNTQLEKYFINHFLVHILGTLVLYVRI